MFFHGMLFWLCFQADFLQFFMKSVKIGVLDDRLGTRHQIQEFQVVS